MSNAVCLTDRQQKFYNYFVNYAKSNGMFPNPTQTGRDMNCKSPAAANMYGVLLLKGAFTNGQPLTSTYKARHSATPVTPVNIANFKLEPKPKKKAAKKKQDNSTSIDKTILLSVLSKLLRQKDNNHKSLEHINTLIDML